MTDLRSARGVAVLILAASIAGCISPADEEATAGVNVNPRNSEVYVKRLVPAGPAGGEGSIRVLKDSIGYTFDSEAILVYASRGQVTASVPDDSVAFYAYFISSDGRLQRALSPGQDDGWKTLTVDATSRTFRGKGIRGNTFSTVTEYDDSWEESESQSGVLAIVPMPRYQYWSFNEGDVRYKVSLVCTDGSIEGAPCAGPVVQQAAPQLAFRTLYGSSRRESDVGGYFLEVTGPRLSVAWREPMHWEWDNRFNPLNRDKEGWFEAFTFAGRLESDAPIFSNLRVLANAAQVVISPDGRRIDWRQEATPAEFVKTAVRDMQGGFYVDVAGHYDAPPPRIRASLQMDEKPVDGDDIMVSVARAGLEDDPHEYDPLAQAIDRAVGNSRELSGDGGGGEFSFYPRP